MKFKRTCFEAILEEVQNSWEVPDDVAMYSKKYFEKYVSDKELKDNATLNSPVLTNLSRAKTMDDYFVELLEDQKKKRGCPGWYFQEVTDKNTKDYGTP